MQMHQSKRLVAVGQRGAERHKTTGAYTWHAKDVRALKAVAW